MDDISRRLSLIRVGDHHDDLIISEDLFFKVLSYLPVKSLLRFRCLSKRWLHVISNDPYFFRLHSQQSKSSKPSLVFFSSSTQSGSEVEENNEINYGSSLKSCIDMEGNLIGKFEMRWRNNATPDQMSRTSLDLVCFRTYRPNLPKLLHVCNPSTHELITLPPFLESDGGSIIGFGYVESTDEYKIVSMIPPYFDGDYFEEHPDLPTQSRVFTLGMTEDSPSSYASPWAWRDIGNSPYHVEFGQRAAFVDGALHWVISRLFHPEIMTEIEQTILAFDLESEEFRLVPRPTGCLDLTATNRRGLQLVEMRGLLYLSHVAGDKMDIWMLKDHNSEDRIFTWVKEYSIDLSTMDGPYYTSYVPRDIQDDRSKVLIEKLWSGRWFYYHLQTSSISDGFNAKGRSFLGFYTESLRSLRHVLQKSTKFDKIIEDNRSQYSQQLADLHLEPPIYIVRVCALFFYPYNYAYGGYITDLTGDFVAIEGKQVRRGDWTEAGMTEAEAKAILCGLQFAREQGIQRIGLISNATKMVEAIITGERQSVQGLENILALITDLLSKFSWAQIFHDRRMSTQVAYQLAYRAVQNNVNFCFNEQPEWFIDG